jgi:hypothetical protein
VIVLRTGFWSDKNLGTADLHIGFAVLTAVVMKSTIFWDIKLSS